MRKGLTTSEAGKLGAIESAKTAATRKQNRIDAWNAAPKLCKFCSIPITYENRRNDFCNHSCAAAFNNKGVRRHGEAPIDCLACGNKTSNNKFCSTKCQSDFEWAIKKEKIKTGDNKNVAVRTLKKYLSDTFGDECDICSITEWCGQPVPLVMDHISGNPYDNRIENLRLICHNCNAQTPTFAGKNKGNGRFERAKRYSLEKEIYKQADIVQ